MRTSGGTVQSVQSVQSGQPSRKAVVLVVEVKACYGCGYYPKRSKYAKTMYRYNVVWSPTSEEVRWYCERCHERVGPDGIER